MLSRLRSLYPDQQWKAHRGGFGWMYENNRGDTAYWVSCLAPKYDGDDETSVNEFYIYPKEGTPVYVSTKYK
jgi:hypothetical protein